MGVIRPPGYDACADVTPQFRGMARQFIARVKTSGDEANQTLDLIYQDVKRRGLGRPFSKLRPEHLAAIRQRLLSVAQFGRLFLAVIDSKREFDLHEGRVFASELGDTTWENGHLEQGVSLIATNIKFVHDRHREDSTISLSTTPIVSVSAHALGRFYQRGFGANDESLIDSMQRLANAWDKVSGHNVAEDGEVTPDDDVRVSTKHGEWRGYFRVAQTGIAGSLRPHSHVARPLLCIRTLV